MYENRQISLAIDLVIAENQRVRDRLLSSRARFATANKARAGLKYLIEAADAHEATGEALAAVCELIVGTEGDDDEELHNQLRKALGIE